MSMQVGGAGEEMCDINTTPLIDVMLVLLVTLIITLPVMTHAVKLDMPDLSHQQPPPPVQPEVIDLEIDFDGTVVWNGTPVPNMDTLEGYFHTYADRIPSRRFTSGRIGAPNTTWWRGYSRPRSATA